MKVNEVPQDHGDYKDRDKLQKLMYAVGSDGKYSGVVSSGWEAEHTATSNAWDAIDEALLKTKQDVENGKLSPIPYFMHKNLMDLALLAAYAGKWKWQVKRHFKPSVFKNLPEKMIQQYAAIFKISPEELIHFGSQKSNP